MSAQVVSALPPRFGQRKLLGASKGVSLSTAAAFTATPFGTDHIRLVPRNFATAVVARWRPCPQIVVLKNQDALATQPVDASWLLQDGDNTVTFILNSLDTLANGDALYVACTRQFGGVYVDVQNTNGSTSTMTAYYGRIGGLGSVTITDNTSSGGNSLAQDGTVTWTPPADWAAQDFNTLFGTNFKDQEGVYTRKLFWVRLVFSGALDSTVSLNQMFGLAENTAYDEIVDGFGYQELWETGRITSSGATPTLPDWGFSAIEALTDAGTANLLITGSSFGKFSPVAPQAVS